MTKVILRLEDIQESQYSDLEENERSDQNDHTKTKGYLTFDINFDLTASWGFITKKHLKYPRYY